MQHGWQWGAAVTVIWLLAQAVVRHAKKEIEADNEASSVQSKLGFHVSGRASLPYHEQAVAVVLACMLACTDSQPC